MFSSKSFIVSGLTFRSLIHFEFIFVYGVRKCSSFILLQVSICVWVYLWAFYFVPLIYISVFVPVPYSLDDCGFVVEPDSGRLSPPVPFFFLKILWLFKVFLYFHTNCEIICSSSVKNTTGSLIGIALNVKLTLNTNQRNFVMLSSATKSMVT